MLPIEMLEDSFSRTIVTISHGSRASGFHFRTLHYSCICQEILGKVKFAQVCKLVLTSTSTLFLVNITSLIKKVFLVWEHLYPFPGEGKTEYVVFFTFQIGPQTATPMDRAVRELSIDMAVGGPI